MLDSDPIEEEDIDIDMLQDEDFDDEVSEAAGEMKEGGKLEVIDVDAFATSSEGGESVPFGNDAFGNDSFGDDAEVSRSIYADLSQAS